MNPQATILSAAPGVYADFRPALVLGRGLPTEIDGKPVKYYWKESLLPGKYFNAKRQPFEVSPDRIDLILNDFNRAKAKGHKPFVTPSHYRRTGNDSFGFIIDARKNERGGLELLHQLIGEDAHLAASRNGSSIFTREDVIDEYGEKYAEIIDHNAILPDPLLRGLGPFVPFNPAIAASRSGDPLEAEVFTLGAAQKEEPMTPDLLKALGLSDGASEADAIKAVNALKTDATSKGLALSSLTTERDTFKAEATAKGLELSRRPDPPKPLDPEVLTERRLRLNDRADRLADAGYLPADVVKLKTLLLGTDAAPNGLMLSRSDGASDCRAAEIIDVLAQCRPAPKLGVQGIVASRQQTPEDKDDPEADRKEAADWQARQLHSRGLQPLTA